MSEFITLIIVINLLIYGFYKIFQIKWPELYFAVNDQLSHFISTSPERFFLFRLLPPLIITSLIIGSISAQTSVIHMFLYGGTICLIHAFITNGKSLMKLLFWRERIKVFFNYQFQVFLHIFTIAALFFVGGLGGVIAELGLFKSITPTLPGIVDNIWSTLITAVASISIYDVYTKRNNIDVDKLLRKSHEQIDSYLIEYIHMKSDEYLANERLVLAVCIVENLQRPKWIRSYERIKSNFSSRGTYGIMQVMSEHWISDEQSIDLGIKKYFTNSKLSYLGQEDITNIITKYNPSEQYSEMVWFAYCYLPSDKYDEVLPG
jgi:hypothetical protein